jgi:hypothetical protein
MLHWTFRKAEEGHFTLRQGEQGRETKRENGKEQEDKKKQQQRGHAHGENQGTEKRATPRWRNGAQWFWHPNNTSREKNGVKQHRKEHWNNLTLETVAGTNWIARWRYIGLVYKPPRQNTTCVLSLTTWSLSETETGKRGVEQKYPKAYKKGKKARSHTTAEQTKERRCIGGIALPVWRDRLRTQHRGRTNAQFVFTPLEVQRKESRKKEHHHSNSLVKRNSYWV